MTYIQIIPENKKLCVKNYKFRMTWLKNSCIVFERAEVFGLAYWSINY